MPSQNHNEILLRTHQSAQSPKDWQYTKMIQKNEQIQTFLGEM